MAVGSRRQGLQAAEPVELAARSKPARGRVELWGRARAGASAAGSAPRCAPDQVLAVVDEQLDPREAWRVLGDGRSGSRSAARAIANASIGSDLPRVAPTGGHRPSASAAPAPPAPGSQQRPLEPGRHVPAVLDREPPAAARRTAHVPTAAAARRPASVARTSRSRPSCRPTASTATAQWVSLWTSTPNHDHHAGGLLSQLRDGWAGRRTHLSGGAATLLSSHAGRP